MKIFRTLSFPLSLMTVALLASSCSTPNLPTLQWDRIEQGLNFAIEKLPLALDWLEEQGYLTDSDTANAEIRGLVEHVISNVAAHYLIELKRFPTWDELIQELQGYINAELPKELRQ